MKFESAKPVWLKDKIPEMNVLAGFKAVFQSDKTKKTELRITGQTVFKVYVNGEFLLFGPDRTAHGFARVRVIDITEYLQKGMNNICIEAAGYNVNGYGVINERSFIQANFWKAAKLLNSPQL